MMEAVKIGGRLDLVECVLAAGARLDVQVRMTESCWLDDTTHKTEHLSNELQPARRWTL